MSRKAVLTRASVRIAAEPIRWPAVQGHVFSSAAKEGQESDPGDVKGQINRQAEEIAGLKLEIERIRQESERRIREGIESGRAEGNSAARQALSERLETELARAARVLEQVTQSGAKLRRQAEEDLVRLAVAIARRVLRRELTVDSEAMLGLVKAAFARIDQREVFQARTDPASEPAVQRIIQSAEVGRRVKLVADPALPPGSLILETSRGQLDASIETQLDEIQRGFIDLVQDSR
jgi:flagellar assembly protein FliH